MTITGTHDSATGEKGKGFLSWLVTPFARTQDKTVIAQYEAGARFFDFRFRRFDDGILRCAHGAWRSRKPLSLILEELAWQSEEPIYVCLCWEGFASRDNEEEAIKVADGVYRFFSDLNSESGAKRLHLIDVSVKLPEWKVLKRYDTVDVQGIHHCFKTLDFRSWHTLLPIPWLWHKLYRIKEREGYINSHDFL
ncbi:MAG: hypothetical protein SPF56_08600 [Bacteroidaceae bacterium]|nr:hypothetical protein [Bacteroidaceae bacterium]